MEKKIEFKVGKDTLRGKLFIPSGIGPFPGVIFFHGSRSKGETYYEAAKRLAQNGILGFAFNYRGCGISDGDIKQQKIGMGFEDVENALKKFLSFKELDKNRIGLCGSSFGGFLACMVVNKYNFKSLVLSVPAAYAPSSMDIIHESDEDMGDFRESLSYKELSKFKGNLLIVQSEKDEILPQGMVEKYLKISVNTAKKEHVLLKNTGHRIKLNLESKKILLENINIWFKETL